MTSDHEYPLTPTQEGMLYHALLHPQSEAYQVQLAFEFKSLDVSAFRAAWQRLSARHRVFRTRLAWFDRERPAQIVSREPALDWSELDWRSHSLSDIRGHWESRLQDDRIRPFDLGALPLHRMLLIRAPAGRVRFAWTFPHLLLDGWSLSILLDELLVLYHSEQRGTPDNLPEPTPLDEFMHWLQERDQPQASTYWESVFVGFSSPCLLQMARGRIALPGGPERFQHLEHQLTPEDTAVFFAECRRHRVTPNSVLIACWSLVIGQHCETNDVVFGTVSSGRPPHLPGIERLVGLLANTLPLRIRIDRDRDFWTWVNEIQLKQLEQREFESSSLADVRRWSGLPAGPPLFDNIVVFENYPTDTDAFEQTGSLKLEHGEFSDPAHFPLSLTIGQQDALSLRLTYRDGCFAEPTVKFILTDLCRLLRQIPHDLSVGDRLDSILPIQRADLPAQAATVADERSDTAAASSLDQLLNDCLESIPLTDVAIVSDGVDITFEQLWRSSARLATQLHVAGVSGETHVGLFLSRSPESVIALLGILRSGGVVVPLDPQFPAERLAWLIADAGIRTVVTHAKLKDQLPSFAGEILWVNEPSSESSTEPLPTPPRVTCNSDQAAYLLYTSGSTGQPKGVVGTHGGLVHRLNWMWRELPFRMQECCAHKTSLNFVDSICEVLVPLLKGVPLVIIPDEILLDLPKLLATLQHHGVTRLVAVPSLIREILSAMREDDGHRLLKHQLWTSSGEPLSRDLVELFRQRFPEGRLLNLYGTTEVSADVTWCDATADQSETTICPIGRPLDHVHVDILDGSLRPVPEGSIGELYVGGPCLARGYWRRPKSTAQRFIPDPAQRNSGTRLFRTGDLGRRNGDGVIEYVGRLDCQLKIRGVRVEPAEIESVLQQDDLVRHSAVVSQGDDNNRQLVAYVVLAEPDNEFESRLRSSMRRMLPEFLIPNLFVAVDALPRGATGKVDRGGLTESLADRPKSSMNSAGDEIHNMVRQIWAEILQRDDIDPQATFFDLGGDSLRLMRLRSQLSKALGVELSLTDLFEHPTIESLGRYLESNQNTNAEGLGSIITPTDDESSGHESRQNFESTLAVNDRDGHDIAVIGLSGRFPQAPDLATFWANLCEGRECRSTFSETELREQGVDRARLDDPNYVRHGFVLDDVDLFDAEFFGFSPREAELLDPQHRMALECAWEALENAGYDPERFEGRIGLFAGAAMSGYLLNNLLPNSRLIEQVGYRQAILGSVVDYLVTRVSYKLNLRGPSCFVQTACSTSLVAVHLACQSLRTGEAEMALAGGISVFVPQRAGYLYEEGGMESPDGRCYTFDQRARGTVFGSGAGMVVLKRLQDAQRDGDRIDAVIRGTAINNDGSHKVGFTAPSVHGQVKVVRSALEDGDVSASTIDYVEAHGTGTTLGDPIEITALTKAFGTLPPGTRRCAVGSLKPNIGHLDAAAGISGLIKVVLSLRNQKLPPSINFEHPNPKIDFEHSPLKVNATLRSWPASQDHPRRAGVSSFGFGGTNAHVVLEEAPAARPSTSGRLGQLLVLSARSESALESASQRMVQHLRDRPSMTLADVAFTLQVGRQAFAHRRFVVCDDLEGAVSQLSRPDPNAGIAGQPPRPRPIVFLFPGQGTQHLYMARELYREERVFQQVADRCFEWLKSNRGIDLRAFLYPQDGDVSERQDLTQTSLAQLAIFVVEIALARLWISWGIRPNACLGHSVGEVTAACLAEVLSIEDALSLLTVRGRAMSQMPVGCMAAVALPADEARRRIGDGLCIAAINTPSMCVVSGNQSGMDAFLESCRREGLPYSLLETSHAFHSRDMEAAIAPVEEAASEIDLQNPKLPMISNLTGNWVHDDQVCDPRYWGRQLRETVQFSAGINTLMEDPERIYLEVGPGQTLSQLTRQHLSNAETCVLPSLPHSASKESETATILQAIGALWRSGASVDWHRFHAPLPRQRVELPSYSFERRRYWRQPPKPTVANIKEELSQLVNQEVEDFLFVRSWKRVSRDASRGDVRPQHALLLGTDDETGARLRKCVASRFDSLHCVTYGESFQTPDPGQTVLRPGNVNDCCRLLRSLQARGIMPEVIVYACCVSDQHSSLQPPEWRMVAFDNLVCLAQAIGDVCANSPIRVAVVTRGLHDVMGHEHVDYTQSLILGPCRVIPQEYRAVSCFNIDLPCTLSATDDSELEQLVSLLDAPTVQGDVIAIRHGACWCETFEPKHWPAVGVTPRRLRERGVYLIIGGLGGIGRVLARYLAEKVQARLILTSRSPLPARESWEQIVTQVSDDRLTARIRDVLEIERAGGEVMIATADICDQAQVMALVEQARRRFGDLNGVIHAAGIAGGGVIQLKDEESSDKVLGPKVAGTLHLGKALQESKLDFLILASSMTSLLGQVGQVDYASGNAFLDAFAHQYSATSGIPTTAINWSAWRETGMAIETEMPHDLELTLRQQTLQGGLTNRDAVDAFARILEHCDQPQVAVTPLDLCIRLDTSRVDNRSNESAEMEVGHAEASKSITVHPRPKLPTAYRAARTKNEQLIGQIWSDALGVEPIGVDDSFFELGGHSLLAIEVMSRINQALGTELPVARLYEGLTVAFLSGLAMANTSSGKSAMHQLKTQQRQEQARRQRAEQLRRRTSRRQS